MAVTQDWRLFAIRVSPQTPMTILSDCIELTRYRRESGKILVSASTYMSAGAWALTHHQDYLEEIRSHTHQHVDLSKHVKVQGAHPIVISNAREEVHQDQLRIPLASISRFLVSRLGRHSAFDNDNGGCAMTVPCGYLISFQTESFEPSLDGWRIESCPVPGGSDTVSMCRVGEEDKVKKVHPDSPI